MASVNATARTIGVWMRFAASGLRPMASMALLPIQPMEKAGTSAPNPMAMATSRFLSIEDTAVWATSATSGIKKWERSGDEKTPRIVGTGQETIKGLRADSANI